MRELSEILRKRGIRSTYLEGDMAQTQRNNAIDKLKSGVVTVLVATDVAARGIDIDDVTHVMNFRFALQRRYLFTSYWSYGSRREKGHCCFLC